MRRPSAALILIISLLMAGPAIAEPFEDATKAYYRGDYKTAHRLIKPLAEQGVAAARYNLGLMYDQGQGVPQDYAEAEKWYRKATEQGYASAQSNLGAMYVKGQGVPQNGVLAYMWCTLATSRLPASRKKEREMAEKNRDVAASLMTPSQIAEAQRMALEWKPKMER